MATVKDHGILPIRTTFRSPWQNGVAERWVGSVRRDLLDHVMVLNQRHLRRLMKNYLRYYHEDRTHLGLGKDTPEGRVVASASPSGSKIISRCPDLVGCITATQSRLKRTYPRR